MLITLMSLNIIWGYPWTGMMAGSVSLLTIGWCLNWLMRPRFRVGCSLPTSSPAGVPFRVVAHLANRSKLPSLDVLVGFAAPKLKKSSARLDGNERDSGQSVEQFISLIRPHETRDYTTLLSIGQRGIHELPPLVAQSFFPFHLFRCSRSYEIDASIAITPAPLTGENESTAQRVTGSIGTWAQKRLAGEAMEYIGSREYQVGMPVRRWDFASWARLGKPIVREFQTPSLQAIHLIVDCAVSNDDPDDSGIKADQDFEYLLSLAATVISDLSSKSIKCELFLCSETHDLDVDGRQMGSEIEPMLIRMAGAEPIEPQSSNNRILKVIDHLGQQPILVLTLRGLDDLKQLPGDISVVDLRQFRQDSPEQTPPPPSPSRRERSRQKTWENVA